MSDETVRITMLGVSGAGKTTYMLGMYAVMRVGVEGFTFSCRDPDKDLELEQKWERLIDAGAERWPAPNDQNVVEYEFDLNYALKRVMSFDWLDYRGGALSDKAIAKDTSTLKERLRESSCLMLCVSGEYLGGHKINLPYVQTKTGVARMNHFLTELRSYKNDCGERLPPVVIVVTKYDCCRDLAQDDLLQRVRQIFTPLFVADDGWMVAICSVTLGWKLADDKVNAEIEPEYVHFPVTFAVCQYLRTRAEECDREKQACETRQQELSGNIFSRFFNRNELKLLAREMGKTDEEMQTINDKLRLLVRQFKVETLPIFYNGEEVEFNV